MSFIKVWVNGDSIYQEPHLVDIKNVNKVIQEWKDSVFQIAKEKNEDHFVYATKIYNNTSLIEVDLYCAPLDDENFCKLIDMAYIKEKKQGNDMWIGTWHKGTNY